MINTRITQIGHAPYGTVQSEKILHIAKYTIYVNNLISHDPGL